MHSSHSKCHLCRPAEAIPKLDHLTRHEKLRFPGLLPFGVKMWIHNSESTNTGMTGVEPVSAESKTAVLPLHHIPKLGKGPRYHDPFIYWRKRWDSNPRAREDYLISRNLPLGSLRPSPSLIWLDLGRKGTVFAPVFGKRIEK